jgi:hypothetical protein
MFQFETVIVIIGIGSKSDLLYHDFRGFGFHLLLLLLLLIKKLLIVDCPANRRISLGRYLHQVEIK